MIDTHCHLTYEGLHSQADEVIARAQAAGVDRMISVATTPDDAQELLRLVSRHRGVYAAVGLHPGYAGEHADLDLVRRRLRTLAAAAPVVALGEMGLDRHWPEPPLDQQRPAFEMQLSLLREWPRMPGIVHNREATEQTLEMIRDSGVSGDRLVFHCFTGSRQELLDILDLGAMVSFTGVVTFRNNRELAGISDLVPLDRIMIETDAPFLTPEPHRKVRPNEPRFVVEVARFLAARRALPVEEFVAVVDANARRFFALDGPST